MSGRRLQNLTEDRAVNVITRHLTWSGRASIVVARKGAGSTVARESEAWASTGETATLMAIGDVAPMSTCGFAAGAIVPGIGANVIGISLFVMGTGMSGAV